MTAKVTYVTFIIKSVNKYVFCLLFVLKDREEGKVRSWNLKTCTGIIHSYKLGTYLPTNDKILLVHPEREIIFGY